VTSGLRPSSDLDLFAVTARPTDDAVKRRLIDGRADLVRAMLDELPGFFPDTRAFAAFAEREIRSASAI
jgi:hypothetical protein